MSSGGRRGIALAGAVALALTRTPAAQQSPPPAFKGGVDYVEIDVRVLDAGGNPVRDLSKQNFQVTEDGVAQDVTTFSFVDIPISPDVPADATDAHRAFELIRPDVVTNRHPGAGGRVYLIVIDDEFMDASRTPFVRSFLRAFVERKVGPDDLAAVVNTGKSNTNQNFANDRTLLAGAIDRFIGQKETTGVVKRYLGTENSGCSQTRTSQIALMRFVQAMAAIAAGSKAIILVSEGIPFDTVTNTECIDIADEIRMSAEAARRANVPIYPVDPRGLTSLADEAFLVGRVGVDDTPERALKDELSRSQQMLRGLAADTGGFAIVGANDLAGGLDRIVRRSSSFYSLGYYAKNIRHDGKYRKIDVTVNQPGVKVLARRGYTAPPAREPKRAPLGGPAGTSEQVREALNSALPIAGLTLSTTAAVFRDNGADASVAVVLEALGADLVLTELNGQFTGPLEVLVAAVEQRGAIKASDLGKLQFNLPRATFDRVKEHGFRWLSRLSLKPGRYQLRVVAANGPMKQGSVWNDLVVPDFSKGDLAMSDVLISSVAALQTATLKPDKLLGDALPGPPTTWREFPVGDELSVFAEIYDNQVARARDVDVTVFVKGEDGREAFRITDQGSNVAMKAARGVHRSRTRLPLANVKPGRYVLTVEARYRDQGTAAASRVVPFQVVANR